MPIPIPMGLRRSLSGVPLAGTWAGESCRSANFSLFSLESANFAASASRFRGCFVAVVAAVVVAVDDVDDDDTTPLLPPRPTPPFPLTPIAPEVDSVPGAVPPSPEGAFESEVEWMEPCLANVPDDPRIGEDEMESDCSLWPRSCPPEGTLLDWATHAPELEPGDE